MRRRTLYARILLAALLAAAAVLLPKIPRALYPYLYRSQIEQFAAAYGLDPLWIAAIVHTESSFAADAVSPVGAQGLMQLMPATARWMAQRTNMPYADAMLQRPEYNLCLGCAYYAYLQQRFPQREAALAAWNAGEGNVRRWLQQGRHMDVPADIPYGETRRFVQKVIRAYEKYRWLYQVD